MYTLDGTRVKILKEEKGNIETILKNNRGITPDNESVFFTPDISNLHDPFLMPDMEKAVERILLAREHKERIVIFGDYDVDGVSSTALLVRFLTEIGCIVSYRLPHRSRDGYGLKSYVFDELEEKNVTLVITVDCGTRDIEPIRHAKLLGIDVIVTDHHAVPEIIPEEVVALLNPKRRDSEYPFQNLAGSGVAFKLVHGILLKILPSLTPPGQRGQGGFIPYNPENKEKARSLRNNMSEAEKKLWYYLRGMEESWIRQKPIDNYIVDFYCSKYQLVVEIDGATHGADEEIAYDKKRTEILEGYGLKVIRFTNNDVYSSYEGVCERIIEVIREQKKIPLTPFNKGELKTINSTLMRYIDFASLGTVADCMPLTGENRVIATLGLKQMKNSDSAGLKKFLEGKESDGDADIIGFQIGPRINASGRMDTPLTALRWLLASEDRCDEFLEEIEELNSKRQEVVKTFSEKALGGANPHDGILFYRDAELEHGLIGLVAGKLTEAYNRPSIVLCEQHNVGDKKLLVASCRSPEWCHLVELLDECREYFVRYGGHRQAAGFTIEASRYHAFQGVIIKKFREKYGEQEGLPPKSITVECELDGHDVNITTFEIIEKFKPFGIGNKKPVFLIKNLTILDVRSLGQSGQHMSFTCVEIPGVRFLAWRVESALERELQQGNIISPIIELRRNEWNGKISIQCTLISILSND